MGLAILSSAICIILCSNSAQGTSVTTPWASIDGVEMLSTKGKIYQFKGIPYAKPPIGDLRFMKPVPMAPFNDTLDATSFRPACVQAVYPGLDTISEDCLFLNIYAPNDISISANRSVMVWIHGGSYETGSGIQYDGTQLALHGDVIVVTLNYRLGLFGFLSTGDSSARGNYGLWDQMEALKWIRSNIQYFGGNPDSITIFGESAGAFSVSMLAIFPQNKDFFHRVVMQSGSLSAYDSIMKEPLAIAQALGNNLHCSDVINTTSLVFCLRGIDASDLQKASDIAHVYPNLAATYGLRMNYQPVIDGDLISDHPISLLKEKSSEQLAFYQSLDIISGCNSAEGSLALLPLEYFPSLSLPAVNVSEGVPTWVLESFAEILTAIYYDNDTRILPAIYNKYVSTDIAEQGRLLVNFLGDTQFYKPMSESLMFHNKGQNPKGKSFQYMFKKTLPVDPLLGVPPDWFVGAGHAAEVPYVFPYPGYLQGDDDVLSTEMMSYWTNFAKYGDPNEGRQVPYWPAYDSVSKAYLELNANITNGTHLLGDRIAFWADDIPRILLPGDPREPSSGTKSYLSPTLFRLCFWFICHLYCLKI